MDNNSFPQKRISFAGFIWFWQPSVGQPSESRRERFFSTYGDLRQTLERQISNAEPGGAKWKLVRISEPGRRFLGFVRAVAGFSRKTY